MTRRNYVLFALVALLSASCLTPEQRADVAARFDAAAPYVAPVVTKVATEGAGALFDPSLWLSLAGLVGAAFGVRKATQAAGTAEVISQVAQTLRSDVDYAQQQVDSIYDATHAPKVA